MSLKFTPEEEKQFWAEIWAQAIQDNQRDLEFFEKHRNGQCNKDECCEEKWIVLAKKLYPSFRIENGLILFE